MKYAFPYSESKYMGQAVNIAYRCMGWVCGVGVFRDICDKGTWCICDKGVWGYRVPKRCVNEDVECVGIGVRGGLYGFIKEFKFPWDLYTNPSSPYGCDEDKVVS